MEPDPDILTGGRSFSLSHRIGQAADAFEKAWESGASPAIDDYLARCSNTDRAALVQKLVMVDIERRWRAWNAGKTTEKAEENQSELSTLSEAGTRPPLLDDYVSRFPELGERSSLPEQLVVQEYRVRLQWGDRPSRQEYLGRYPNRPSLSAPLEQIEAQLDQALCDTATFQNSESRLGTPPRKIEKEPDHPQPTVPFESSVSVGTRIGPYKLLEQLGEGGMGSVWLAEQTEPVRRNVALKLIKPGMDYGEVLARFAAERQALALMDHPNIAKVLDAGAAATGQPYFVMELVKGVRITRYCDDKRLTIRERLDLFIAICQAIQHAHQKGVIHRDIKPSNVLVALYDGKPIAKVIDFGLAKATGRKLTDNTLHTVMGQVLGTVEYMAPEQAESGQLDIDTRSDIYSLGVLLYELLTGTTPLVRATLRNASLADILRRIQEEESPRPSLRVSQKRDELKNIAQRRKVEANELPRILAGDLDWIALKALEKDRDRRYETATAFARDIERYLHDEPVHASPPSAKYRLKKFVKKHRLAVAAIATIAGVLLIATGASTALALWALEAEGEAQFQLAEAINARNAEKQAAQESRESNADTQAFARFLVDHVLATARPEGEDGGLGVDVTVRTALEAAQDKIDEAFRGRPRAERVVRSGLGHTWYRLGEWEMAVADLELTRALTLSQFGPEHPETLDSINNLAVAHLSAGDLAKAISLLEETLQQVRAKLGPEHPATITSMNNLAAAYQSAGEAAKAIPLLDETLQLARAKLGPEHSDTLSVMNNLAAAYRSAGEVAKAIPLLEKTLKQKRATLGLEHSDTLSSMSNLAGAYESAGKFAKAISLHQETLELRRAKLGPDHPDTLKSMGNLANAYRSAGDVAKAIPRLEETLQQMRSKLGPEHSHTLISMNNLAAAYDSAGEVAKAIGLLEETVKLTRARLSPEHPGTLASMNNLAAAYDSAGNLDKAIPLYLETLKTLRAKHGPEHPDTLMSMNNLAAAYHSAGDLATAIPLLEETLKLARAKLGPEHPDSLKSMGNLAKAYQSAGDRAKAIPLLEETLKQMRARLGPEHPDTLTSMNNLAVAHHSAGDLTMAIRLLEETLKGRRAKLGPEHPDTLMSINNLAIAYSSADDPAKAIPLYEETLKLRRAKLGPEHPAALTTTRNLANAYDSAGDLAKAILLHEETLNLLRVKLGSQHPHTVRSMNSLSWMLSTSPDEQHRDGKRAIELAREACEATNYNEASVLSTLAAAYAETGNWDEAVKWSKKSLEVGDKSLTDQFQQQLTNYEAKKPWRDTGRRPVNPADDPRND